MRRFPSTRPRIASGPAAALLLAGAIASAAAAAGSLGACSSGESNAPLGKGDTLIVDVEASAAPPNQGTGASDADLDPDGIFDPLDSSSIYGKGSYDAAAYAVLSICLPPDGGASTASDGGKAAKDAGAAPTATPSNDAGYLVGDAGCVAYPSSCVGLSKTDACTCLLGAFSAQVACTYADCAVNLDMSGFTMYCPP
jgi:hypothetical protein